MPFLLNSTDELTPDLICNYIQLHRTLLSERYQHLKDYYEGRHAILHRKPKREDEPCNNVVCNFCKYISDFAAGYLIGEPISYQSESNIDDLLEWFKKSQVDNRLPVSSFATKRHFKKQ